jgi:hypothetical protein
MFKILLYRYRYGKCIYNRYDVFNSEKNKKLNQTVVAAVVYASYIP